MVKGPITIEPNRGIRFSKVTLVSLDCSEN